MPINNQKNFDCVAAAEHLHEYLDDELKPELRAAMEQHLASCADCAATLAQLRQIEAAHRRLDEQILPPPEAYWQTLPSRVMERVKLSEKRRLLALPKLPRLKSPIKRTPLAEPATKRDLLYLSPAMQRFLRGSGKYVLPLAAVAAFCFFMIRELWEKPETSITTVATSEQPTVQLEPEATFEKSMPATPPPAQETLAEKPVAAAKKPLPAQQETGSVQDSFLVAAAVQGAGGRQGADLSLYTKVDSPITFSVKILSAADLEKEAQGRDDQARPSRSRAAVSSAEGRGGVSVLGRSAAINQKFSEYDEAQQRAQQTSDLKKREKIWRDFLKSNPDSSQRGMAMAELARTLAAASDSTTKPEQLEKKLAFFRDNAAILQPQMGTQEFDHAVARLQMLLNSRRPPGKIEIKKQ